MVQEDPTGQGQGTVRKQNFQSQAPTKGLILVAAAVIIGILLVMIVNSNNDSNSSTAPTTTVASQETEQETTEEETAETTTTTTTVAVANAKNPSQVNVLVLNGSNITGIAGLVTQELDEVGYRTLTAGNEASNSSGTTIYYKTGFENDARQLSVNVVPGILTALEVPQEIEIAQFPLSAPSSWDQDNLIAANVVVVVGNS